MANPFKIIVGDGTKLAGFVTSQENQLPRQCGNCVFYKLDHCHHPVVIEDPDVHGEPGKPKPVQDEDCCNYFRSPKRVLMYAVRHGEDENDHLIGGWEDAPIDAHGVNDAKEAAKFLKDKGIRFIICSDMKRTMETCKIIAKEIGIKDIVTDFRLRTWNKGYLNGEKKTDENRAILKSFKENPHRVIKDGESHYQFEDRSDEAYDYYLDKAREEGVYLVVLHNSGIKQLQRYCEEHQTGDKSELSSTNNSPDSVKPGGILKVQQNKDNLGCEVVLKEAEKHPNERKKL